MESTTVGSMKTFVQSYFWLSHTKASQMAMSFAVSCLPSQYLLLRIQCQKISVSLIYSLPGP